MQGVKSCSAPIHVAISHQLHPTPAQREQSIIPDVTDVTDVTDVIDVIDVKGAQVGEGRYRTHAS